MCFQMAIVIKSNPECQHKESMMLCQFSLRMGAFDNVPAISALIYHSNVKGQSVHVRITNTVYHVSTEKYVHCCRSGLLKHHTTPI